MLCIICLIELLRSSKNVQRANRFGRLKLLARTLVPAFIIAALSLRGLTAIRVIARTKANMNLKQET